jgi:hypothetical protein
MANRNNILIFGVFLLVLVLVYSINKMYINNIDNGNQRKQKAIFDMTIEGVISAIKRYENLEKGRCKKYVLSVAKDMEIIDIGAACYRGIEKFKVGDSICKTEFSNTFKLCRNDSIEMRFEW